MSFPNSGTSFTTALIRNITKTATATNYFSSTKFGLNKPISPSEPDGPFYTPDRQLPDSGLMLTKTHCGGCKFYCNGNLILGIFFLHSFIFTLKYLNR